MLYAVEVRQFDNAAGLAPRAGSGCHRVEMVIADARVVTGLNEVHGLLQEERHARHRALVAQRAEPGDVARARVGAAFAA